MSTTRPVRCETRTRPTGDRDVRAPAGPLRAFRRCPAVISLAARRDYRVPRGAVNGRYTNGRDVKSGASFGFRRCVRWSTRREGVRIDANGNTFFRVNDSLTTCTRAIFVFANFFSDRYLQRDITKEKTRIIFFKFIFLAVSTFVFRRLNRRSKRHRRLTFGEWCRGEAAIPRKNVLSV